MATLGKQQTGVGTRSSAPHGQVDTKGKNFEQAMLETGCARMTCGMLWYLGFLKNLKSKLGIVPIEFDDTESHRFGPGSVTPSLCGALLPISVHGKMFIWRVSIVERDVPLVVSHEAMCLMDMSYHARSKNVHIGKKLMKLCKWSATRKGIP